MMTYYNRNYVNVAFLSQNTFCTELAFPLKRSTLRLLFGVSKSPASLLLGCGAVIR